MQMRKDKCENKGKIFKQKMSMTKIKLYKTNIFQMSWAKTSNFFSNKTQNDDTHENKMSQKLHES